MATNYIVAAYHVDQAFGGHEEGGWWFTTGELVRIVKLFHSEEHAYQYCRRLNERLESRKFGPNQGAHEISSVLSEGEIQGYVFESCPPKYFPERRPHYE
jgi:hypothetical protein